MAHTFIRFQLHKARTNKDGQAPVKVVLHLNKPGKPVERRFIPTDKKIRPENWQGGKAIFLNKEQAKKALPGVPYSSLPLKNDIEVFNADLKAIEKDLRAVEGVLNFEGNNYTLQDVINRYKAKNDVAPQIVTSEPKIYITDFIDEYVQRNQTLVNPGTLTTYVAMSNQLKEFGAKKADRITFANLNKLKLDSLLRHYVTKGYNNSTTSKHFSNLKKLIRIAINEIDNLEVNQAFREYTPKILSRAESEPDVIILEQHEFNALMDFDFTDLSKRVPYTKIENGKELQYSVSYKTLYNVRNLFIFSCVTGFRFSDIADLKREHIQGEWIIKKQVKGGKTTKIEIPLNAISSYILHLYQEQNKPLPSISNQKANDFLKVLGRIAGISDSVEITTKVGTDTISKTYPKHELMSMHMGRRVFTSLTLAKGGAMQDVMSLTGHKKFASFKRYVSINKTQKQNTMNLWGEIEQPVTQIKAV